MPQCGWGIRAEKQPGGMCHDEGGSRSMGICARPALEGVQVLRASIEPGHDSFCRAACPVGAAFVPLPWAIAAMVLASGHAAA